MREVQFPWHFPQMIYAMTILQPRFYPHISSSRRGVAAARPIPIPVFKFTPSRFPTLSVDRRSSFFALYNISHLCGMWEWDGAKRVNQISPRLGLLP